jgi:hypothetical protein
MSYASLYCECLPEAGIDTRRTDSKIQFSTKLDCKLLLALGHIGGKCLVTQASLMWLNALPLLFYFLVALVSWRLAADDTRASVCDVVLGIQ